MIDITFLMADGSEKRVSRLPEEIKLERVDGAPKSSLTLTFQTQWPLFLEEPWGVRMEKDGVLQFLGIVDEHLVRQENGGREEIFSCRCRAAMLLDSEAKPGMLRMPSLRVMEMLYLLPFGLHASGVDFMPKPGEFIVEKGKTCWAVLNGYGEQFLGCTPFCGRDGTVCFSGQEQKWISLPTVKWVECIRRPAEQISRVVVQNARSGAYNAVYENPAAVGVDRVRYLSARDNTAPRELIAEGERKALQMRAVCLGFADAEPGNLCDLSAYGAEFRRMRVTGFRYTCTQGRGETELTFEREDQEKYYVE